MLDEIARLEEVIYYLGNDKAQLKEEGSSLQKALAELRDATAKEKDQLNTELRNLKQQLLDKDFEC